MQLPDARSGMLLLSVLVIFLPALLACHKQPGLAFSSKLNREPLRTERAERADTDGQSLKRRESLEALSSPLAQGLRQLLAEARECEAGVCPSVALVAPRRVQRQAGETVILVLDSGMRLTPLSLYRNRVLGFYSWRAGRLQRDFPELSVPSLYAAYSQKVAALAPQGMGREVPAELREEFVSKMAKSLAPLRRHAGHGDVVFNILAERLPRAKFVLVEDLSLPDCFTADPESLRVVRGQHLGFGHSVQKLALKFGAQFINLSSGWSWPEAQARCRERVYSPSELRAYGEALAPYYRLLSSLPETLLVQAGPAQLQPRARELGQDLQAFALDCAVYPQRFRVNALVHPLPQEPKEETGESSAPLAACADLYWATAPVSQPEDPSHFHSSIDGLVYLNFGSAPSYLAPLALSYLEGLRAHAQLPLLGLRSYLLGQRPFRILSLHAQPGVVPTSAPL